MTWFKVDDGLAMHPKVLRIPRRQRPSALGLWLLAGTWSARHLTDGVIPRGLLVELGCPAASANALVEAGLWDLLDDGWGFHDWEEWQPTRSEKEAERAVRAEAGRAGGRASGATRRSKAEANAKQGASTQTNPRPDPTRPDPKSPMAESVSHLTLRTSEERAMIDLDKIEKATGGSPEHARRVADTILNATTAEVTNPTAYVLRAIANDPDTHRPTTTPPVFKSRRATGQPFGDGAA